MGVDYTAFKGIGFKVKPKSWEDIHNFEEVLKGTSYRYFVSGNSYVDDDIEVFVILDKFDPIKTLELRGEHLKQFLITLNLIDTEQEIGLAGGLYIS